jgi:hypothetical protein
MTDKGDILAWIHEQVGPECTDEFAESLYKQLCDWTDIADGSLIPSTINITKCGRNYQHRITIGQPMEICGKQYIRSLGDECDECDTELFSEACLNGPGDGCVGVVLKLVDPQ